VRAGLRGLIAAGLLIWLALRLSMAAPMTFADNQFRLFESWTLTKGQGWRLLGVACWSPAAGPRLELVGGWCWRVLLAAGGLRRWRTIEAAVEAFMAQPPLELLRDLWPWLARASARSGSCSARRAQAVLLRAVGGRASGPDTSGLIRSGARRQRYGR
jgi:hypothetical protein